MTKGTMLLGTLHSSHNHDKANIQKYGQGCGKKHGAFLKPDKKALFFCKDFKKWLVIYVALAGESQVEDMAHPEKEMSMECALCGYTASGKFGGDICPQCNMTYWRCSNCKHTVTAFKPSEECPSGHQKTDFVNITCYTPECGGPGHIDPRL